MSKIKDTFFGGAEKKAGKAQVKAFEEGQRLVSRGVSQARKDIQPLFSGARQSAQQGFQGALDVFGQTLPQQAQAFQGGNIAAQQTLLSSLPLLQSAILGGQVNTGTLQPFQAQPDLSFAQQQLPVQQAPAQQQANVNNPLTGVTPTIFGRKNLGRF